jgi:hypothetical protein
MAALAIISVFLGACAGGTALRARDVREPVELSGTFDLVLYLGPQYDFLETVAFLDVAGDGYEILPFEPEFEYKVLENLSAKDAMGEALHFVSRHRDFSGSTYMRRIAGETGETIGYELRPLYDYFVYGMTDVLDIDYLLGEEGKVRVLIDLDERLKRELEDGGDGVFFGD